MSFSTEPHPPPQASQPLLLHELSARLSKVKQQKPSSIEAAEAALQKFTTGTLNAEAASAAIVAAFADFPAQCEETAEVLALCNPRAAATSSRHEAALLADHLLSTTTADSDDSNTAAFGPSHAVSSAAFPDIKDAGGWPADTSASLTTGKRLDERHQRPQEQQQSVVEKIQTELEAILRCSRAGVGQEVNSASAVQELSRLAISKGWAAVDACFDLLREWKVGRVTTTEVRLIIGAAGILPLDKLQQFLAAVMGVPVNTRPDRHRSTTLSTDDMLAAPANAPNEGMCGNNIRGDSKRETNLQTRMIDISPPSARGLSYLYRKSDGVVHHSSGAATQLPAEIAAQVNRTYVSISRGSEDFIVPYLRRNAAEETMFADEDALFEADVAITSVEALAEALKSSRLESLTCSAVNLRALIQVMGDSAEDVVELARLQPAGTLTPLRDLILDRLASLKVGRTKLLENQILPDMEKCYYRQFDGVSFHTGGVDKCMLTVEGLSIQAQLLHLMNRPYAPVPQSLLKLARLLFRRLLAATGGGFPGCPNVTRAAAAARAAALPLSASDTAVSASPVTVEWSDSGIMTPVQRTTERLTLETAVICSLGLHVDEPFGQNYLREWIAKRDSIVSQGGSGQQLPLDRDRFAITTDTVGVDLEYNIDAEGDSLHGDLLQIILLRYRYCLPGVQHDSKTGSVLQQQQQIIAEVYLLRHIFVHVLKLRSFDSMFDHTSQAILNEPKTSVQTPKQSKIKNDDPNNRFSHITSILRTATVRSYISYLTPQLYALLRLYITAYDRLKQLRLCLDRRRNPTLPEAQLAWAPGDTDPSKRLTWEEFLNVLFEHLQPSSSSGHAEKTETFETSLRTAVGIECPSAASLPLLLTNFATICSDALLHPSTQLIIALNTAYDDSACGAEERRSFATAVAQKANSALMAVDVSYPGKVRFSVVHCENEGDDVPEGFPTSVGTDQPDEFNGLNIECDYIMHRPHTINVGKKTIELHHAARFAPLKTVVAGLTTPNTSPSFHRGRQKKRVAAAEILAGDAVPEAASPPRTRLRASSTTRESNSKQHDGQRN